MASIEPSSREENKNTMGQFVSVRSSKSDKTSSFENPLSSALTEAKIDSYEEEFNPFPGPSKVSSSLALPVPDTSTTSFISGYIRQILDDGRIKCVLLVNNVEIESNIPTGLFEEANIEIRFGLSFFLFVGQKNGFKRVFLKPEPKSEKPLTSSKKKLLDLIDSL